MSGKGRTRDKHGDSERHTDMNVETEMDRAVVRAIAKEVYKQSQRQRQTYAARRLDSERETGSEKDK